MNRRDSLAALAALWTAPRALAQSLSPLRVAWLAAMPREGFGQVILGAFLEGMAALGYVRGRNLILDERWSGNSPEETERQAAELIALKPAMIVTAGAAARAASKTAASVPVVFGFSGNPIDAGLSTDFARPDRNMTGISFMMLDLVGKRIEILKEVMPRMGRIAVLSNQLHAGEPREYAVTREAADRLGIEVSYIPFKGAAEVDKALAAALQSGADAGMVFPDASITAVSATFAAFTMRHRMPFVSGWAAFAERGNLLTYGPNLVIVWRRVAYYVDRIAKGARPADLPIELPTTVELVVNARTATALGLKIPQSVLLRADRVIE
jgi:putative ABC transport system substrate-binding protein